ncbi:MAG: HD domain-containing phosphohydrolase [Candidatus Omnitrophota bacterium]
MIQNAKVLLICNNEGLSSYLMEHLVKEGSNAVFLESSPQAALEALRQNPFDVIIVTLTASGLNPVELVRGLKGVDPTSVIVGFLEEPNPELERELSNGWVYDFINKPIDARKLDFLIKKGAELHCILLGQKRLIETLREGNSALEKQNAFLSGRIEESTKNLSRLYENLRSTYMRTIKVLAQAIDARDHYTHSHSENVAKFAVAIAQELKLSAKEIETLREACELHDLGKIGVDDSILSKTSSLNEFEWQQVRRHPVIGAKILEPLTFLSDVVELVRQHHEHYDGLGYPEGRSGDDILLGARIIHLADAYESMRSARSYRKTPLTKKEAVEAIKKNKGAQFDPKVVEAFLAIVEEL